MQKTLVITFIANDRPGLADTLSSLINQHQGNWLESKLAQMAGKFTGIIEISIHSDQINALQSALKGLSEQGISVLVESVDDILNSSNKRTGCVNILGLDRTGIVKEITQALAAEHINVERFYSKVEAAPMSGEPLFKAEIDISLPSATDIDKLDDTLENIAQRLDIDYQLSIAY